MEVSRLSTDVLIVGGGLAGINAMGAAEKGAGVVVADSGNINGSGDVGGDVDPYFVQIGTRRKSAGDIWFKISRNPSNAKCNER